MNYRSLNLLPTAVFFGGFLLVFVLIQSFEIHRLRTQVIVLEEIITDLEHDKMLERINQGEPNED